MSTMSTQLSVEERIAAVNADVQKKNDEAVNLLKYLNTQREKALVDEAVEEEELKRKGIIIGQHVPSLKSQLDVDPNEVSQFATFAPTLLVAKELVNQNRTNFLRRTGNLPISDLAESKKQQNDKRKAETVSDAPNYTILTKSAKWRDERVGTRFADSLNASRSLLETKRIQMSMSEGRKPPRKPKKVLSAEDRIANEEVLNTMQHKANYLRNPRNDPGAVTKMLVKSKAHYNAGPSMTLEDPSNDANGTVKTVGTSMVTLRTEKKKYGKVEKIMNNPLFSAEPKAVFFSDYAAGQKYTQPLTFRNISAVTRSLRVIPPTSLAFHISPLKFPANCNGGMVAPGMSVTTVVTFTPPTLGDFKDVLPVETESGNFDVNLAAQREPPNLSIPSTLDVGCCLVGDAQRVSIACQNTGGGARFVVMTPEQHDSVAGRTDSAGFSKDTVKESDCMRLPPFTVYPTEFTLLKNESLDLIIEFVPLDLSFSQQVFYIWCDNGQIRRFLLNGESRQLHTVISEINHVPFDCMDPDVFPDVCFPAANIGCEQTQKMLVVNDTGLPVEYEWVWLDMGCQDLNHEARERVYERERLRGGGGGIGAESNPLLQLGDSLASSISGSHHSHGQGHADPVESLQEGGGSLAAGSKGSNTPASKASRSRAPASAAKGGASASLVPSRVRDSPAKAGSQLSAREVAAAEAAERGISLIGDVIDSPEKKRLLKSLQMTMDGHGSRATSGVVDNMASRDGFDISPARGVLPGDGAETFEISFTPRSTELSSMRAVMVIKSVPCAALPGPFQQDFIAELRENGHGDMLRCRSWLEDCGTPATVDPYLKENGSLSTSKNLISLQSLLHLVITHALAPTEAGQLSSVDASEFERISRWSREVIKYLDDMRKVEVVTINDDNSSIASVPSVRSLQESVGTAGQERPITTDGINYQMLFYEWKGGSDTGNDPQAAQTMPLLQLCTQPPEPEDPEGDEHDEGPYDDSTPSLRDFSAAQREIMNDIWLDSTYSLAMLGGAVAAVLDGKVKHECVDFIKECALTHLAGPHIAIYGEGRRQTVTISPPRIAAPGLLSVGKDWMGEFTLINPASTPAEITVVKAGILARRKFSPYSHDAMEIHDDLTADEAEDDFADASQVASLLLQQRQQQGGPDEGDVAAQTELVSFDCEYDHILVMPQSEVVVKFSMSINNIGRYEVTVPLRPKVSSTDVDNLVIDVHVAGPQLRFEAAEVDLGLVGVGNEGTRTLTFSNESCVPAMFAMRPQLHLDISAGGKTGTGSDTSRSKGSGGGSGTARSNLSRMSSARSEDFSVADSQASSNGEFKIELKNAVVSIDPPTGVVAAGERFSVNVICKAGKIPQRIRGLIESRVYDVSGRVESTRQYLNMRGEVQAPKTKMYPLTTNLGLVFVGRPVKFKVHIENMCNLPTIYKLLRPGGESSLYKLKFDKHKGPLDAKEIVTVECTFTAVTAGLIDDIISNKIFGAKVPLAFVVKAKAKGVSIEFVNLEEDEEPPEPLADPAAMQLPNDEKPPDPKPIEPILLGDDVPLYKRRKARFYLRNLSAIPVPYTIRAKRFSVQPKKERFGRRSALSGASQVSVAESAASLTKRDDLVLAPHEGGMEKFQSAAGKEYLGATVYRQEDRQYLYSGLGASYHLDVRAGELPPWGVQVVTIDAYNDIPGCYDDEIECEIVEGDITRVFLIPIEMSVTGCPIVIEKDTVGMSVYPRKGENKALVGKSMLQLGTATVNAEPLVREFCVKNHGSKEGRVRWQVKGLTSKANGPIKVSMKVDELSGRLVPVIKYWEDIAKDSPFVVEPNVVNIAPYAKKKFKVTLFRTQSVGMEMAHLTGNVSFHDGRIQDDNSSIASMSVNTEQPSMVSSRASAAANQRFVVDMLLEGTFLHPTVMLDRTELVATDAPTVLPAHLGVVMKAKAPLLFVRGSRAADVCNKQLTLVNPTMAKLVFSVSTEGPYTLREVGATAPAPPAGDIPSEASAAEAEGSVGAGAGTEARAGATQVTQHTTNSLGLVGKIFNLFPNESGTFQLDFNPRKDLREKLIGKFGTEAGMPTEQPGKLILTYPTGQSMHVPITTKISTPFLAGSTPRMYFGVCHTHHEAEGVLLLSNPTDVPARWAVQHVPGQGAWRRSTAIRVRGFAEQPKEYDESDVFEITPNAGMVDGPTVSVTAAIAAPPQDLNRRAETIVPQRTVKTSWARNTLSMQDSLELRHKDQRGSEADACYPMPIKVRFKPKKNVHYSSRYRFTCEFANSFDLVLQGEGTYEEHLHKPLTPMPTPN